MRRGLGPGRMRNSECLFELRTRLHTPATLLLSHNTNLQESTSLRTVICVNHRSKELMKNHAFASNSMSEVQMEPHGRGTEAHGQHTLPRDPPAPTSWVGALPIQPHHGLRPQGGEESGSDRVRPSLGKKNLVRRKDSNSKIERGTLTRFLKREGTNDKIRCSTIN